MFAIAFGRGGGGFMFLTLAPWSERERSQAEITSDLERTAPTDSRRRGFRPDLLLSRRAGSLFAEFGFVLAFAVTVSSFVALTLAPMLASRVLARTVSPGRASVLIGRFGTGLAKLYGRILDACLGAPLVVVVVAVGFAAAAVVGFRFLPAELTPLEDRGFIPIFVSAPQATTVDYTDGQIRQIEAAARPFLESGEATNMFAIAFGRGGGGFMFLTLAPWSERERSQGFCPPAQQPGHPRRRPGAAVCRRRRRL